MTNAEQILWQKLHGKQILGVQFYRQKPILNFIVDFYCPKAKLIIECDGSQHYTEDGLVADRQRDEALNQLGLRVLRFSNFQIIDELEAVCEFIYQVIEEKLGEEKPKD